MSLLRNQLKNSRFLKVLVILLVVSLAFPQGLATPKKSSAEPVTLSALAIAAGIGAATGAVYGLTKYVAEHKFRWSELESDAACRAALVGAARGAAWAIIWQVAHAGALASWAFGIKIAEITAEIGLTFTLDVELEKLIEPYVTCAIALFLWQPNPITFYIALDDFKAIAHDLAEDQKMKELAAKIVEAYDLDTAELVPHVSVAGLFLYDAGDDRFKNVVHYNGPLEAKAYLRTDSLIQGIAVEWMVFNGSEWVVLDSQGRLAPYGSGSEIEFTTDPWITGNTLLQRAGKSLNQPGTVDLSLRYSIYDSAGAILDTYEPYLDTTTMPGVSGDRPDIITLYIEPRPAITITSPNGGETPRISDTLAIAWDPDIDSAQVKIEISRNGGSSWSTISDSTANDGSYTWMAEGPVSTNCLIKITSVDDSSIIDISDGTFSITEFCNDHDLQIVSATLSSGSIKPTGSTSVTLAIKNNGPTTESSIPVTLAVTGPGYSDSSTATVSSIAPGSILSNFILSWTPGRNGWAPATQNGSYTLSTTVMSGSGCDAATADNQSVSSVYVSESGDPPSHYAFQIKMYEVSEGNTINVNGHSFEFSSYSSGEAKLYVDGSRFYLEQDEGNFTSDLQTIFWWHRMVSSVPRVMHLMAGTPADSKVLVPYHITVPRGEDAVFQDPQGYSDNELFLVTGNDTKPIFDASVEPPGSYNDSGSTIRVSTGSMAAGTHRFAILTDQPAGPTYTEYIAFGRIDVVAPQYTLNIGKSGTGSGSVRITANGSAQTYALPVARTFTEGTSVQIQALPDTGSRFNTWAGASSSASNPIAMSIGADTALDAVFTKTCRLTLTQTGSGSVKVNGGTVTTPYSAAFDSGTVLSLQAIAGSDSIFSRWSGDLSGSATATGLTMNSDKTVSADFLHLFAFTNNLDTAADGIVYANGVVIEDGIPRAVPAGTNVILYAAPFLGASFVEWTGDIASTEREVMFTMNSDMTTSAHFNFYGGDVDQNGQVNLADAIRILQLLSAGSGLTGVSLQGDISGDDKIGLAEAIFVLDRVAQRNP